MVRIFKTNVERLEKANGITAVLSERLPAHTINFDLEDCDKILRIEGDDFNPDLVIRLLKILDYECKEIE